MNAFHRSFLALVAALFLPAVAHARDTWTIVVPTAAAGSTDILSKALAKELAKSLDADFTTENLPGKAGSLAGAKVAKAAADARTLLMATVTSHAIATGLPGGPGYDPRAGFTPIAMVGTAPYLLVVSGQSPHRSMADLVAASKAQALRYSSTGVGGPHHMVGELFARRAGAMLVHVPYKGGAPALKAVIDGDVQTMIPAAILALPRARDGSIRVLATSGARRSSELPDVRTMAEAGLAGFAAESWYVLVGPPGMPAASADRIAKAVEGALADPAFKALLKENGVEGGGVARAELPAFLEREAKLWGGIVKDLGVDPQ